MKALVLAVLFLASPSLAARPELGFRIGFGPGFGEGEQASGLSVTSLSLGPAAQLNLPWVGFEVDLLYTWVLTTRNTLEITSHELDLPVLAHLLVPIVPKRFDLKVGTGLQTRVLLDATYEGGADGSLRNDVVLYLPLVAGVRFHTSVAYLGLDARYLRQLTEVAEGVDQQVHHFIVFANVFF